MEVRFILQWQGESSFDVSMSAYGRADVCELIGTFMLSLLSKHISKNYIGLYRDAGLAILKNTSGPEAEQLKKKLQNLIKEKDLDIIINLKITNYLDILPLQKTQQRNQLYSSQFRPPAINY